MTVSEDIRRILALTFVPMTSTELENYLAAKTRCSVRDSQQTVRSFIKSRSLVSSPSSSKSYSTRYSMETGLRLKILLELINEEAPLRKRFLSEVASQEEFASIRWTRPGNPVLRQELSRGLLFPDESGHSASSFKYNSERDDYGLYTALLDTIKSIAFNEKLSEMYGGLIPNLPFPVFYELSADVDMDCNKGVWSFDYDRVRQLIDENLIMTDTEKAYLYELFSWPLHLFRDDFRNLGFDQNNVSTSYGNVTLAVREMDEGNPKKAEKFFRAALRCNDNELFGNCLVNLLLVSALRMSGTAMALKTLDSYRKRNVFKNKTGHFAVIILLQSFVRDIPDDDFTRLDDYSRVVGFIGRGVSWMVADKMAAPKKLIPELARFAKEELHNENFRIFQRSDLIPYDNAEKWEKTLNYMMMKLGYGEKHPSGPAVSSDSSYDKIVYLIGRDGEYVQPVLKKSKDGVNWSKGRNVAIKTFAEGIPQMSDLDRSIASHVRVSTQYWGARTYELGGPEVMAQLCGSADVYKADNPDIKVSVIEDAPYIYTEHRKGKIYFGSNVNPGLLSGNYQIKKETDILYKVTAVNSRQKEIIVNLLDVAFPAGSVEQLRKFLGYLGRDIVVHSDSDDIQSACETVSASSTLTLVLQPEGEGLKLNVYAKPFVKEPPYLTPGEGLRNVMSTLEGKPVRTSRNFKKEKESLDSFLAAVSEILGEPRADGSYCVETPVDSLSLVETIMSLGDQVRSEWPEGCRYRISAACDIRDLDISLRSGVKWFELTGELKLSEEKMLSIAQLLSLFSSAQGHFVQVGRDEFIALSDRLRQQIAALSAISQPGRGDKVAVPFVAAPVLGQLKDAGTDMSCDRASAKLLKTVSEAKDKTFELPRQLMAELRPYQEEGFQWLCRLADWGAGACLADDMGLGKTIQAIAILLHRAARGPALVVAPASVAANWGREILRFAPALQVHSLNEMNEQQRRQAISSAGPYDVVLTTYGVLLSQIDDLASREWESSVLDEAHIIKNRDTKSSSACMRINAGFRMILTGTPLQNNLGELWNLFQYINPGYLGSFKHFSDTFIVPIQEYKDKERQKQLKRMVLPFLLRRTKSDVLDELPPKTEQIVYVDMDDVQTTVYESIRRQAEMAFEEHSLNLVQTLSEITKLRLACCSPVLVNKELPRQSAKTQEIVRLLQDLIGGGHKALVFSQFTSFLDIISEALASSGIEYLYLDGSTALTKRQSLIRDFQTGSTPVFLISLKAGGLGLNLTSADYVIHADPWWNPAVEQQASDRAYRMGQTRPVTVYHIISKNSIEEKILRLHSDKRSLSDALLEGADISSRLSREEILNLLEL